MAINEAVFPFDELAEDFQNVLTQVHDNGGHIMIVDAGSAFVVYPDAGVIALISRFDVPEKFGIKDPVYSVSVHGQDDVPMDDTDDGSWIDNTAKERILGRTADEVVAFVKRYGEGFLSAFARPKDRNQWSL